MKNRENDILEILKSSISREKHLMEHLQNAKNKIKELEEKLELKNGNDDQRDV